MQKRIKWVGGRIAGYGSICLFGLLATIMLFPIVNNQSYATCVEGTETEGCAVSYANADINMTTKTAISLTVENQVNLELVPKSSGAVAESSIKVGVATNSSEGYALYLGAGNADGNLKPVTSNIEGEIANTTKTGVTLDNLETNSYGYALSSVPVSAATTYTRVPVTGEIIKSTDTVTVGSGEYAYGDAYYLSFGTKIGTSLPAGTYAGSVVLSAVANPTTLRSLYDITYMQEMTSELCEATGEHYTKQLIDTRDGKSYWVAKLKDGNCWMTQNLALDITETGLKAVDTDIEEDWNQDSEYPPVNGNRILLSGKDFISEPSTITDYWNLGFSMTATPFVAEKSEVRNCTFMNSDGQTLGNMCEQFGFVDLDETWKPTFTAQDGIWTFDDGTEYAGWIAADKVAKIYDAHYLLGNYYTYNAATAGSGGDLENGVANESICPKNWQLPKTAKQLNDVEKTYFALLSAYDLVPKDSLSTNRMDMQNMVGAPLYFASYSQVYPWGGYASVGSSGDYTTATASLYHDSKYILHLNFNIIDGSVGLGRADGPFQAGFQMRCVAR